jgi:hypothetical protein
MKLKTYSQAFYVGEAWLGCVFLRSALVKKVIVKVIPSELDVAKIFKRINAREGECWEWAGKANSGGYGVMVINYKTYIAHRLVFSIFNGSLNPSLVIDHICRNRKCVNPDHLEQVTSKENLARSPLVSYSVMANKKFCKRGHEFNKENTFYRKRGRACRACARMHDANRYAKKTGRDVVFDMGKQ